MTKILRVLGMIILVIGGTTIAMGLFPLSSSMLLIQSAEATTDLLASARYTATIVGKENSNDVLQGTEESNVIVGLSGNDQIFGNGGDYVICGGTGNDVLIGGASNTLTGGLGSDRFIRGRGTDIIFDFNTDEGDAKTADCEKF